MKTIASLFFVTVAVFGFSSVFGQGEPTSGKERVREKVPFEVGKINTMWTGRYKEVGIWLWSPPNGPLCCSPGYKLNPEKLQYALPEETELKDIDPTAYQYRNDYWYPKEVTGSGRSEKSDAVIPGKPGQIVILKLGNKYAAIKPMSVERRWNSVAEMQKERPDIWEGWRKTGSWKNWPDGLPPYWEWMTYEWKYWDNPTPRPKPAVASLEKKLQEIGLTAEEARRVLEK